MTRLLVRFLAISVLLLPFLHPALAGDKTSGKTLDIGPKGVDLADEVKTDDEKVAFTFEDKTMNMPTKVYNLKPANHNRYRITMDGEDPKFDAFLILKNKKGDVVAFDDDSGGKLNSMIKFSFAADGAPYRLFAASLHGKAGAFHLQIEQQATVHWDPAVHELNKGTLKLTGELTDDRQEIVYQVKLNAKKHRIDMTSGKLDSYLELRDSAGKLIAEDDDKGGKLNARITKTIGTAGTYRIVASSTNQKMVGPFTLEVKEE